VNLGGDPYWYIAGNLAGIMLTPDLDVDAGNFTDTIIRKVSSKAQWVWRRFWTPYAVLLPHRGKLSHFPVLSTLVRLGYILTVINLLNAIIHVVLSIFGEVDTVFLWWWNWSFFFGLCHVDAVHWAADQLIKGKEQFIDE
jgi:uncharacterized metal-binding protein